MIFRQWFEADSSTYTYLLADEASGQALLIVTRELGPCRS